MALSGDHCQTILLDSTFRNRAQFPYPTEFETTVKPDSSTNTSDPLGVGYILHSDVVVAYDSATSPDRIQLTTGIAQYENSLLGQYIEVLSAGYVLRGTATVVGFTTGPPFMYVYLNKAITGVIAGDLVYIRQIRPTPYTRFNPVGIVAAGATTVQIANGIKRTDAYKGMFLRDITTLGIDHRITAYDYTTGIITFSPVAEVGGFAVIDYMEIYSVEDNEGGLSELGSVSNRNIPINHEIRLDWLRIPRHPLYVNNTGDTPISYPLTINNYAYLIVEFHNKSFGSSGVIQSNNRNLRYGQFIVPIEDLSTGTGKFYTLRSPSPVIIRYSANDVIQFKITLPSGRGIRFDPDDEITDTLKLPNPDMQVVAQFSVRRILN